MYLGWRDDTRDRTVADRIRDAAERYQEKFGKHATQCLANPADVAGIDRVDNIEVKAVEYVRPNQYWVGVPEGEAEKGTVPGRR